MFRLFRQVMQSITYVMCKFNLPSFKKGGVLQSTVKAEDVEWLPNELVMPIDECKTIVNKYRKESGVIGSFKYDGDFKNSNGDYYVPLWAVQMLNRGLFYFDGPDLKLSVVGVVQHPTIEPNSLVELECENVVKICAEPNEEGWKRCSRWMI